MEPPHGQRRGGTRPQDRRAVGYTPDMDEAKASAPKVCKGSEYRVSTGRQYEMLNLRPRRSPVDYVIGCIKRGYVQRAQRVVKTIWPRSSVARLYMEFVFSFGRLVSIQAAEEVLPLAQKAPWMKDLRGAHVLQALIRVCAERGDKEKVEKWTKELEERNVEPTIFTYNSLLRLHVERDDTKQVYEIMKLMKTRRLRPNIESYNNLLRLYTRRGDQQSVQSVVMEMQKEQVDLSDESCEILLTFFRNVRNVQAAEELYKSIVSAGKSVPANVFHLMMHTHLDRGNVLDVLECHKEMTRRKLEFGRRSCVILFKAIYKTEDKSAGLQLLRVAAERRVRGTCSPEMCQETNCAEVHIQLARHVQKLI
eukprot:Plantae.Rhodophyta-Purpureofilum_apyrenoidigerum.ctg20261.p1 GENE.Plantae.Rhodophyta-Purpureofilum_apyrenoidigerum.ctg20261~~Plantae.Rhodophyta-Purpureofilum_apyrenoidigerum.ctg20261.p1  ORF type:complete len:365 (+),score=56.46 Plantae.Rhodophyta-Purpureofilum_apyrenoidigerum.ctg20261:56-1150(+)